MGRKRRYLFEETGEFRCPRKGEWYISRSGGIKQAGASLNGEDRWIVLRKVGGDDIKVEDVPNEPTEKVMNKTIEQRVDALERVIVRYIGKCDIDAPLPTPAMPLKPCPFCGGEAEMNITDDPKWPTSTHWVWCTKCDAQGVEQVSLEAARAAWNRRVTP